MQNVTSITMALNNKQHLNGRRRNNKMERENGQFESMDTIKENGVDLKIKL